MTMIWTCWRTRRRSNISNWLRRRASLTSGDEMQMGRHGEYHVRCPILRSCYVDVCGCGCGRSMHTYIVHSVLCSPGRHGNTLQVGHSPAGSVIYRHLYMYIYIYTHILHTLPLRCHSSISSPCCGVCPAPPIPLAREIRGRIRRHGNTAIQRKLDEVIEALSPAAMPGLQCSSCSGVKLLSF